MNVSVRANVRTAEAASHAVHAIKARRDPFSTQATSQKKETP
jgi:hypothetical protein